MAYWIIVASASNFRSCNVLVPSPIAEPFIAMLRTWSVVVLIVIGAVFGKPAETSPTPDMPNRASPCASIWPDVPTEITSKNNDAFHAALLRASMAIAGDVAIAVEFSKNWT